MPHPGWCNHSRREGETIGDLRRADELRLVCVEDVHRRAIIAPYDALPVVHYFAGANVEAISLVAAALPAGGRRDEG